MENQSAEKFWWKRLRINVSVITLIGLILILVAISLIPRNERSFINVFSICGSVASLTALVIAIVQIIKLRRTSEETKAAAVNAQNKIKDTLTLLDIEKAIATTSLGDRLIKEENLPWAKEELFKLLTYLMTLRHVEDGNIVTTAKTSQFLNLLRADIESINLKIVDSSINVDISLISNHLLEIHEYLVEIENTLKFK